MSVTVTALGYLGVRSPKAEDWRVFGTRFLGGQLAEDGPDGAVRLRFDDSDWRIQITPDEGDAVDFFGWIVDEEEHLDVLAARLGDAGVVAERGSDELAAARGVDRLITFSDPWGLPHEIAWGQRATPTSFLAGRAISGFVTGRQGLGHVVLLLPDIESGHEFFHGVLGFELSDKIITPHLNARFYHANRRHHTLALAQGPEGIAGFHHLMLQLRSIDDVGNAYDLLDEFGVVETLSLGRHTNDKMISFYCATPSSFEIEYGFDGIEITEDWVPRTYSSTAIWGHRPNPASKELPGAIIQLLPGVDPSAFGAEPSEK